MSKLCQWGLLALVCTVSTAVNAKGERYGGSVNMLSIDSIEYEQGDSGTADTIRYGFVHTRPIDEDNNRWRWWLGFNYLSESVDAPSNGIYQEVTNYELRVVPQYALGNWSIFTPYIGAGISAAYSQYSNRWPVDGDGFKYGAQLDDIDQFEAGAVATLGTVIKLGSNPDAHIQVVPQVSYILPIYNDGLGGLELSVSLLF
ncbi:porin family protein [Vibrio hepatarius]|uniref:porin family protein n=1 Tax=Vibrio hepatarius TaxID=171383 RepID=UPI001C09B29D|nr:porin family protein [Vibrio hepatarius]MBU2896150.1 porin family protein [Vibrio hepatarius]